MKDKIFECRQCGHCCQGQTTVSLDPADLERMVAFLRKPVAEVKKRYLRETAGVIQMQIVDNHCIFFNSGCTIHPGKPWRCTQWPLHPSILKDEANFLAIKGSCPGINQEMGYLEFCRRLAALLAAASQP